MSCCGNKRESFGADEISSYARPTSDSSTTLVQYRGLGSVKVSRVPSGTEYRFSPSETRQVLTKDIPAILRTGAFRVVR